MFSSQRHAALSALSSGQPLPEDSAGTGCSSQPLPPQQRTVPVGTIKVMKIATFMLVALVTLSPGSKNSTDDS